MDEKVIQQLSSDVNNLAGIVNEIKHSLNYVSVNNGGGLPVKFRREDFYQKVFNKPDKKDLDYLEKRITERIAKMIKEAPINSIRVIARDVTLIGGMVVILLKLFGIIT